VHAVPVQRGGLVERVGDLEPDALAAAEARRRPRVGAVEAVRGGEGAGAEVHRAGLQVEAKDADRTLQLTVEQRRDRQGVAAREVDAGVVAAAASERERQGQAGAGDATDLEEGAAWQRGGRGRATAGHRRVLGDGGYGSTK